LAGNGFKQGNELGLNLFNIAMQYAIRHLSVEVKSTMFYKSVQFVGCADDITLWEE